VIRSHYGNGSIKQYHGVNKAVENLQVLRETVSAINDNYPAFPAPSKPTPSSNPEGDLSSIDSIGV
jgi:hypothetical protein